jgi:hypothetical protein
MPALQKFTTKNKYSVARDNNRQLIKKNKPMAPTKVERGLPICGLIRPNHVCEVSR